MNSRLLLPLGLLVGLLLALLVLLPWESEEGEPEAVAEHVVAANFTLQTAQGELDFSRLRDNLVLLYFGYTHCPDVCPTSLALLGFALHKLEEDELKQVRAVFISVDPARDSIERLAEYTQYFHPSLIGATGTARQIADIAGQYGVAYSLEQEADEDDYVVNHSSMVYLLDRQGKLHEIIPHGATPDMMVTRIRSLLAQ